LWQPGKLFRETARFRKTLLPSSGLSIGTLIEAVSSGTDSRSPDLSICLATRPEFGSRDVEALFLRSLPPIDHPSPRSVSNYPEFGDVVFIFIRQW